MKKREILFVFIAAFILLLMAITPSVASCYGIYKGTVSELSPYTDGWYYLSGDEKIPCVEIKKDDIGKDGTVVVCHDVQKADAGKWLLLAVSSCGLRAYADGALIYESYYIDSPKYGSMPAAGNNYIRIPEDCEQIALEFRYLYKMYSSRMPIIYIGDKEVNLLYLNHTIFQFHQFMDLTIIMYGWMLILYAVYRLSRREQFAENLYLGMLLTAAGLWLRVGTFDVEIRRVSKEMLYQLSYRLWYVIPVLMCGFLQYYVPNRRKKYRVMQVIGILCAVTLQIMRNAGLAEYAESVFVIHIELVVIFVMLFKDRGKQVIERWRADRSCDFGFVGLIVLALFSFFELVSYFLTAQPLGLFIRIGILFLATLVAVSEVMKRERREMKLLENMARQRELQMKTVLCQLQPHFIFNALGAIRLMIHMNSEAAYDMVYDFSQFMRASFHAIRTDEMIPFAGELAQIKAYINIENKRFNDCVKAVYDIGTENFLLPALTVQPLVAAFVVQIRKRGNGGSVSVRTRSDELSVTVQVSGDICVMDADMAEMMRGGSERIDIEKPDFYMSFANVKRRLEMQADAELKVLSGSDDGMCIEIIMPLVSVAIPDMHERERHENNSCR